MSVNGNRFVRLETEVLRALNNGSVNDLLNVWEENFTEMKHIAGSDPHYNQKLMLLFEFIVKKSNNERG